MSGFGPEIWFPIVTLLAGAGVTAILQKLSDDRSASRDREARRAQRVEERRLRHIDFQRATLLALQECSSALIRAAARVNLEDETGLRQSGRWRNRKIAGDIDEAFRASLAELALLRARLDDDSARNLSDALAGACTATALATDGTAARRHLNLGADLHGRLNDRVGEMLRHLGTAEDELIG